MGALGTAVGLVEAVLVVVVAAVVEACARQPAMEAPLDDSLNRVPKKDKSEKSKSKIYCCYFCLNVTLYSDLELCGKQREAACSYPRHGAHSCVAGALC